MIDNITIRSHIPYCHACMTEVLGSYICNSGMMGIKCHQMIYLDFTGRYKKYIFVPGSIFWSWSWMKGPYKIHHNKGWSCNTIVM